MPGARKEQSCPWHIHIAIVILTVISARVVRAPFTSRSVLPLTLQCLDYPKEQFSIRPIGQMEEVKKR
jgi:hypothetical protein